MARRKDTHDHPGGADTPEPRFCVAHGTELRPDGWCGLGQAYATNAPCPFTCPLCRGDLDWTGGCVRCHGCTTGERVDWTFPGDRYERDPRNPGHYRLTDLRAGRPACRPVQNIGGMQVVQATLARKLPLGEALGHLDTIFGPEARG